MGVAGAKKAHAHRFTMISRRTVAYAMPLWESASVANPDIGCTTSVSATDQRFLNGLVSRPMRLSSWRRSTPIGMSFQRFVADRLPNTISHTDRMLA